MRHGLVLLVAAIVLTAAVGSSAAPPRIDDLMMDMQVTPLDPQPAPPLSVTTFDRARVSLEDLRGQVVLVYFWATW